MIRIKTEVSLPVQAFIKGEVLGASIICHQTSFEGSRVWSYKDIRTPDELAEVKKNSDLRGFKREYVSITNFTLPRPDYEIDEVVAVRVPYKVLLIGDENSRQYYSKLGDDVYAVTQNPWYDKAIKFFPLPGIAYVRGDAPVITPASFDIVEIDTQSLCKTYTNFGAWRDYAEEALRPGGILKIITPASNLISCSRWLATRLTCLAVDTYERGEISDYAITIYGVKKEVKKYDKHEEEYLLRVIEKIPTTDPLNKDTKYALSAWNHGTYPPKETVAVKTERHYDDTPFLNTESLPIQMKITPPKDADVFNNDFLSVKFDDLAKFGKVKLAWGSRAGGYDLDMLDPTKLTDLRKYVDDKAWDLHIKGQKAIETCLMETLIHAEFKPQEGLKPTVLPQYITKGFAEEWFCNEPALPENEEVLDEKQMVFPVAPSLANLMKLFGKLTPAVVQGKDEIFYLASGTVTTEVISQEIIDDKGREVTVENTKKRAKLVTFALTGSDPGQQYEAEMG